MKPVIGICSDLIQTKKSNQPHLVLDSGYADGINAAGGLPLIIPPFTRDEILEEYVGRLDGLLLTGGADLNPRKLGKKPHPSVKTMHMRREESDRILCHLAIDRKIPTLCVGVGMQLMNVMFGGSIYTHLPEDMPRGMPHCDPIEGSLRHGVFVTPRTRLEDIYGEGEIRVNSSHHQGIRTLGKGLRSGALAPDGLIESIECTDPDWFMVGVQWHPESDTASALDRQLFEGFVEAAAESIAEPTILPMAA
ncbi:Putative glutamine amidotransferase [Planctomycetes bacterium Pan216]|uniref:Glutamine amidotransferase n=1 Tax=Kolteria novifilia TaxID=2527975 RepID=A0A518BBK2_9BACT|nr:Putative glutamine amidotransferase [Planctomycetes bacterium Pan216]